jgi:nucleotide-binding universal stress UspA family protein
VAGTLLGSVSLAVAARARCPVVVVRGELPGEPQGQGRIVVGLGKPGASPAVPQFAFEEAEVHGGSVDVVHAWMLPHAAGRAPGTEAAPEWEERQKQALAGLSDAVAPAAADHPDVPHEELAVEGPPKHILNEAAHGARLLVVGAPARTGVAGLPLGPVTHAALHYAPCPVAVVPSV